MILTFISNIIILLKKVLNHMRLFVLYYQFIQRDDFNFHITPFLGGQYSILASLWRFYLATHTVCQGLAPLTNPLF